ncbi:uncharacterized protein LOC129607460, partial [Condylostylus longicornis]|uniref:uncharacterized protein LOC129607460 n=1 Tax=Condylostylus longicornis TaxID=2530218 RepID=UPI00244DC23C
MTDLPFPMQLKNDTPTSSDRKNSISESTSSSTGTTNTSNSKFVKKSTTALLCELTRLKSQRKYLECSQLKFNPDDFDEIDIKRKIQEIEDKRHSLEQELNDYKMYTKRDLDDMWIFINSIKEDINNKESLTKCPISNIRERVIGINNQINKLKEKNKKEMKELKEEFDEL